MKFNNEIKVLFIVALFSFASCQQDSTEEIESLNSNDDNLPTFADFHEMISKPTDGKIAIQSTIGISSQEELRNNYIDGYFEILEEENGRMSLPKVFVGEISLNDETNARILQSTNSSDIQNLFGSAVPIEVSEHYANGRTVSTSFEIYVPKLLTIESSLESISPNDMIHWNKDDVNENGVQIKFDYKASTQTSQEIGESNPEDFIKGFIVPDNGSIKITSDMLEGFPNNSDILITIARGNIDYIDGEEEMYTTGAITAVSTRAKVLK